MNLRLSTTDQRDQRDVPTVKIMRCSCGHVWEVPMQVVRDECKKCGAMIVDTPRDKL